MVYYFPLPTTSHFSFSIFLSSSSHPALPQLATTTRHTLRLALKHHQTLNRREQENHFPTILNALNEYLPYLFAISYGLSGKPVGNSNSSSIHGKAPTTVSTTGTGEEIEITLRRELELEWRPVLTSSSSLLSLKRTTASGSSSLGASGKRTRVKGRGIDFEIAFVLTTLGYVLSNIAGVTVLRMLYASTTATPDQRTAAVQSAKNSLLQASSVHSMLASSPALSSTYNASITPDLDPATQSGLSSLALAEATLLAVLKDDAYTFSCIQARNPNDREWMVKAPDIPKLRALILARVCVRGAEYAEQAASGFGSVGRTGRDSSSSGQMGGADTAGTGSTSQVDEAIVKYAQTLVKVARARACRFQGVDAELAGKVGEGIAWLRAGRGTLGFKSVFEDDNPAGGKSKSGGGLSRLKREWTERREEKKLEKGTSNSGVHKGELERGDDAGREEEGRVLEMLEKKWMKMNDTINTQIIPPSMPLLSNLPSGRDIHSVPPYSPPALDEDQLIRMRAPPEDDEQLAEVEDESEDEGINPEKERGPPGAFPTRSATADSAYY